MTEFSGKKVLITGAAGGLGEKMALEIARQGACLILLDIAMDRLQKVAAEIVSLGAKVSCYRCDLSQKEEIYDCSKKIQADVGTPDIIINNAGIVSGKSFLDTSDDKIEKTFLVNTLAPIWLVKFFLPEMIARRTGHIVNISSAAGTIGVAGLADYCGSKFGLFGFDESLRNEFKKKRIPIHTTIVCPYYINTGMFDGVKTRFPWILPILDESRVVQKIVHAIKKNRACLMMPWIVYAVMPLRIFPVSIFDWIAQFLGIHTGMDEFKGRK